MLSILAAVAAMAVKDGLGTLLIICEARGRAIQAGILDAANDLATILVTLAGAGAVITHGWSAHTFAVLAAMTIMSFIGTAYWTRIGQRIKSEQP